MFPFPSHRQVRCPFGCSEFLHRANKVPLKDFLWSYSNYQMPCQNKAHTYDWTDFICPSYPSSCSILENKAFQCSPSIVVTDEGPMILTCRDHNQKTKQWYLYVPESPTGTIHTPNGNSCASVTIRPRIFRVFKVRSSCSFEFFKLKSIFNKPAYFYD